MHCVAGDASGIVLAAAVTAPLRIPAPGELGIEYVVAFLIGWTFFQSAPALLLGQGSSPDARVPFVPELVSPTALVAGMFPLTHWLRGWRGAAGPETLNFWGRRRPESRWDSC
jgi:hypothetical protein